MRATFVLASTVAIALYACSTASTPDEATDAQPDAASPAEAGVEAPPGLPEASTVADAADPDAGPCIEPPVSKDDAGDRCYPAGACPTCAEGVWYRCADIDTRPMLTTGPLADAKKLGANVNGYAEVCGPPACVRSKSYDPRCSSFDGGVNAAYACATDSKGDLLTGIPSGCVQQVSGPDPGAETPFRVVCCQ